jgi:hypothetical protein
MLWLVLYLSFSGDPKPTDGSGMEKVLKVVLRDTGPPPLKFFF